MISMNATTVQPATGNPSFQERAIDVIVRLGQGAFGQSGFNTVTLSGLRVSATINKAGMPSMDRAEIRIFGVQPSIMNAVSTLGIPLPMVRHNNVVTLQAGDPVNGMATVFSGYIQNAWQDFNGAPETMLRIISFAGADAAVIPVPPISFPGGADVATIMATIAKNAGWGFENNGVQVQLSNAYFPGTALQQAQSCARAANIEKYLDSSTLPNVLAIWPKTGTRKAPIPLISAASGMIGYPQFRDQGVHVQTVFRPEISACGAGRVIQVQSSLGTPGAQIAQAQGTSEAVAQAGGPNGFWMIYELVHELSAQIPNGPWWTGISGARTIVPGK